MQLFKLRYFQIKRDLGYWILFIAIACFYLSKAISETSFVYCSAFIGIILFAIYTYHNNRKDLNFIFHYLYYPKLQTCINYNLLLLPLSFALATGIYWKYLFFIHLVVSLLSMMYFRVRSFKFLFISKYIAAGNFEWISGIRKNFPVLGLLVLIALILSPVKLFGVVALFLLNAVFLSFYNYFEPLLMLNPENLTAEIFLRKKIAFLIRMLLFINIPLLTINVIFNSEVIWFDLGFMLAFLLLGACTIYIKYANYKPNTPLRLSIDYLILIGSVLLIYLIPLSIFIYFSNKKKAIANLSNYIK